MTVELVKKPALVAGFFMPAANVGAAAFEGVILK